MTDAHVQKSYRDSVLEAAEWEGTFSTPHTTAGAAIRSVPVLLRAHPPLRSNCWGPRPPVHPARPQMPIVCARSPLLNALSHRKHQKSAVPCPLNIEIIPSLTLKNPQRHPKDFPKNPKMKVGTAGGSKPAPIFGPGRPCFECRGVGKVPQRYKVCKLRHSRSC